MNRKQRRIIKSAYKINNRYRPNHLTPVPPQDWPFLRPNLRQVWLSKKYLVQLYNESNADFPGMLRLSICRTEKNNQGRWVDRLTWDELQAIKSEIGYGDWYAVEVYPSDSHVVNDANMRHLWLLETPLSIGWEISHADG